MSIKIQTGVMKVRDTDGTLKNIDMLVGNTSESIAQVKASGDA